MEIGPNVTLWQGGVEEQDGGPEHGAASYLFEASTVAFSALLRILVGDTRLDPGSYQTLRGEFRKFYLWNEGFCTGSGDLDQILSSSKNLKATVLNLMVLWSRAISKVPNTLSQYDGQYDWSTVLPKFAELKVLTYKADQVAKAAMLDMNSQCSAAPSNLDAEYDSDSDSDESSTSDENLGDIIDDLSAYMESLVDLSPSLENPAIDSVIIEDFGLTLVDVLAGVSEPARPFVLIIKDRFPSLDIGLVRKLGEANWNRHKRLRDKLATAPEMDMNSLTDDDASSAGDTVVDQTHQSAHGGTLASTVRSSMSVPSTFPSTTTGSGFSEPSIFDSQSISAPRAGRPYSFAESITSFATSRGDGLDYGQRRVPNMPEHEFHSPFQCNVCGDVKTRIRHRADWKKHVYDDLEPYVCLATDCIIGLHTFKSRREWMEHEFQVHRILTQWACPLCSETFTSQNIFQNHLSSRHFHDVDSSQIEEVMSASKRLIPGDVTSQACPFCLTVPANTQRGFASHVGKHQQEISLAALPNIEDTDEDGSSDDDEDGDDDHSDPDSDQDERGSKSVDGDEGSLHSDGSEKTITDEKIDTGKRGSTPPKEGVDQNEWTTDDFWIPQATKEGRLFFFNTETGESSWELPSDSSSSATETGNVGNLESGTRVENNYEPDRPSTPAMTVEEWFERMGITQDNTQDGNDSSEVPVRVKDALLHKDGYDTPWRPIRPSRPLNLGQFENPRAPPGVPESSRLKSNLVHDGQMSVPMTWGPQNRFIFTMKDFEKPLEECTGLLKTMVSTFSSTQQRQQKQLLLLLTNLRHVVSSLVTTTNDLKSRSEMIDDSNIEKVIERLAICRTQLVRLQKFLESTTSTMELFEKKNKRQSLGLRQLFTRQTAPDYDIARGESILVNLGDGARALGNTLNPFISDPFNVQNTSNLPIAGEFTKKPEGVFIEEEESLISRARPDPPIWKDHVPDHQGYDPSKHIRPSATLPIPNEVPELAVSTDTDPYPVSSQMERSDNAETTRLWPSYNSLLHDAIKKSDIAAIESWIRPGADINARLTPEGNALQITTTVGPQDVFEFLLAHGANVNSDLEYIGPPLQAAVITKKLLNVQLLLSYGAVVNARGGRYGSALRAAVTLDHVPIARLLLASGATISSDDHKYFSSLREARGGQMDDLHALLTGLGPPSASQVNNKGQNPLPPKGILEQLKEANSRNIDLEESVKLESSQSNVPSKTDSLSEDDLDPFDSEGSDEAYPCKGCGEILEEGKAFELAGNRWHIDCFRCNTCGTLLDSDANLLLLGDGSLICNNCTYSCSGCGNKIEDLAILTGDQAFCSSCFRCRNCKRRIENLRYARTSQGIFCMSCHESLMARRRKKSRAAYEALNNHDPAQPGSSKQLPPLPPSEVPPPLDFESDRNQLATNRSEEIQAPSNQNNAIVTQVPSPEESETHIDDNELANFRKEFGHIRFE